MSLSPKENGDLPASMMTKREMMAMHAMAGCLSAPNCTTNGEELMRCSILCADALLAELAKETK